MHKNQKGFSIFEGLLLLVLIAIIGFVGWYVWDSQDKAVSIYDSSVLVTPNEKSSFKRVVAVGDIACDPGSPAFTVADSSHCQSKATSELMASFKPDAILALGDLQYENGTLDKFMQSYDKHWGTYKSITYPAPGNHEYLTPAAQGYFNYFNGAEAAGRAGEAGKGYYSVDIGSWHIIALNSNCEQIGGCDENSPQFTWLEQDLAATTKSCTLAFWHHPHFTSGRYAEDKANSERTTAFWNLLFKHRGDLILNGHDHLYERFTLQSSDGKPNPEGVRQFTVGTGGKSQYKQTLKNANSEKMIDDRFGVLSLDLFAQAYHWKFVTTTGEILDSGTKKCTI